MIKNQFLSGNEGVENDASVAFISLWCIVIVIIIIIITIMMGTIVVCFHYQIQGFPFIQ